MTSGQNLSGSFRSLFLAGLMAAACCTGYVAGYSKAAAEGEAALNALKVEHEEEGRRAADAYGKAVAAALTEYRNEVARGDALAERMAVLDRTHAAETRNLRRQIADATKGSTFTLSPDAVRLLNEAAGAAIPDAARPGSVHAAGADGRTGAGAAPATRLLDRAGLAEQFNGVTEADLVAWFIAYAQRTHWLEERLAGWQRRHRERRQEQGKEARPLRGEQ